MATKQAIGEQAILGLLYLEPDGSHGYELARRFSNDALPGAVLHLEAGMLYHYLKRLETAGMVSSTIEPQDARPTRQVYHLSQAGKQRLLDWLQEPVTRTRDIRLEFLVKRYFAMRIEPDLATRLLQEQLAVSEQMAIELRHRLDELDRSDRTSDEQFLAETTRLRLDQTDAAIGWLRSLEAP